VYQNQHNTVWSDATTHKPQPYTELYFTNPDQLPSVAPARHNLPVSFTVHNLEGHTVTYIYAITFTNTQGQTTTLREQPVTVSNGRTITVDIHALLLPTYQGRGEVSVALLHHPEAIHFWVVDQPVTGVSG
jgi:hypothetical protein